MLIETLPAAFEMDEILYELRDHSAGLNCGRWDYIFSCIKKLRRSDFVFADRALVTMTSPFLRAYCQLLVKTCHRRNAHAMGGMAAQIPIKHDAAANDAAMAKVLADKEREAGDGFDGTWVAHPGLVALAKGVFDRVMPRPNQLANKRADVKVKAADLLAFGAAGPDHRAGPAHQHQREPAVHRLVAGGPGLRAHQQSDGRRGDRRDLALADLAMDPQSAGASWPTAARSRSTCSAGCWPRSCAR